MRLQLNTAALERLLEGEDGKAIKLDLQQSVIEEFGRRHIKAFANDGEFAKHINIAKDEAIKDIESMFGEWTGSYSSKKFKLNRPIQDMIKLQAKTAVTYELDKVEGIVSDLYSDTAKSIQEQHELHTLKIQKQLDKYLENMESEVESIKAQLLTTQIDDILRAHIKSILSESFGAR